MNSKVSVNIGDPRNHDAVRLLSEGDEFYRENYPPESNHLFSIDDLLRSNVYFFIARIDVITVGICALVIENEYAELKRMWVDAPARRLGVGLALLKAIESQAKLSGVLKLRLETGVNQADAISFYLKNGFKIIAPFGDYLSDPLSVFMEKHIL